AAAQDNDGHGTFVSGVIASETNDASGYAGVGWNVTLQEYKVLPNGGGGGFSSDVALAINDAIAHGAKAINVSLAASPGTSGPDPGTAMAVANALAAGIPVVGAAGNDGAQTVSFPAAIPGVISVGASAIRDNGSMNLMTSSEYVAAYSNGSWSGGSFATLVAPGGDPSGNSDNDYLHWITNTWTSTPSSGTCVVVPLSDTGCGYELGAGTSAAAPHVSGAIALMLSKNPNLSPAQVMSILTANADDIGDVHEGAGRLNVYRALAAVSGDSPPVRPTATNFVAIAFTAAPGSNRPHVIDLTFPTGRRLPASGAFRIADVPSTQAGSYDIGLWYDANGNGVVDAGDYFGYVGPCSASAPCSASSITVHPIAAGFAF
ncbi:MAG: S8 family serine peptidase, partial [Candidatus Eremiobacteraeota bacterium]|nr:S8 family serine peptidase [Candidatus Eremiobacteraeota bacterium]